MLLGKRTLLRAIAVAAVAALILGAATANGKKIEYSTNSEEAKELVGKIANGIENFENQPNLAQWGEELVKADPNWAFGYMYASQFQAQQEDAVKMLEKAKELSADLNDGERRYMEGVALIRAQNVAGALEVFKGLAKDYPGERRAHMLVGQLAGNSDPKLACESFKKSMELDDSTARIYGFLGNCMILDAKYAKAEKLFDQGLTKVKGDGFPFGIHFGKIFSRVYQRKVDQALARAESAVKEYTNSPNAQQFPPIFLHNLRARIALEGGRLDEAMKAYKAGLESLEGSSLPEQQIQIWTGRYDHGRARTLAKMGKHEEAWAVAESMKKQLDEGGDIATQFIPAWNYLVGYLKLEAGEYREAIDYLINGNPVDPFQRLLLARAYLKLGEKEKAKQALEEVVQFNQNTTERALAYPEAAEALKKLGG